MPARRAAIAPYAARARFYLALAQLLAAGMPADRAVLAAADRGVLAAPARRAAGALSAGRQFVDACRGGGLLPAADAALLAAADHAGALVAALQRLAARHAATHDRLRRVRGRLMLPAFVLVVGVLAASVPAWFAGHIDATGFAVRTVVPLAGLATAALLGVRAIARAATSGVTPGLGALLLAVPIAGKFLRASERISLIENLGLLLRAGVPAVQAGRVATAALVNPALRARWRSLAARLEAGGPVVEALAGAGVLDDDERMLLASAEAAGRLDEGLERAAAAARSEFEGRLDLVAEWVPRLVYAAVVAVLAGGLIG